MSLGAILSGHVLDPGGRGVAGAELVRIGDADHGGLVILGGRREPVAVTGADGSFRIDQLACGSWKLLVHAEDHPDRTFEGLAERPGEEVFGLEFVLAPGTTITGRVADVPEDERAKLVVRAAKVRDEGWLSPFRARTADVEPAGRFTLRGLEIGTDYDLRLRRAEEEGVGFGLGLCRARLWTARCRRGLADTERLGGHYVDRHELGNRSRALGREQRHQSTDPGHEYVHQQRAAEAGPAVGLHPPVALREYCVYRQSHLSSGRRLRSVAAVAR